MVESLSAVDVRNLLIVAGLLLIVFVPGLWYVKKTTGRPMRDMLAALEAGIALMLLLVPVVIVFHDALNSPDRHTRQMTTITVRIVFMGAALAIWWVFNNLAKKRVTVKEPENKDDIG